MALIVDTVDRLQRSFRETPVFNDLMQQDVLELHFVKEGNVLSKDANSSQKLMWNMGVVMAQSYTDQLSDNVRRSIHFKVRNGEWCGMAPLGYLNAVDGNTGKATVIPNTFTSFAVIQRLPLASYGLRRKTFSNRWKRLLPRSKFLRLSCLRSLPTSTNCMRTKSNTTMTASTP